MEFNGLTSASHMSLPEAGYGSEEGQLGSEISGAVSGVTTPGASRLQASQLQERSATMQRLQGPRCCRLQNIGDAYSMPLLQIQTRCASLLPNLRNCFHAVLSRYRPKIAICKYETRLCARARATRSAKSRLATYYYLPRERRVMGLLAVLLRVTQYASAVTSYLSV